MLRSFFIFTLIRYTSRDMKRLRVLFMGQGKIGSAIHHVLMRGKGQKPLVACWDVDSSKMTKVCDLSAEAPKADVIFLCVPSWCLDTVAAQLRPLLSKETVLVSVSKGLDAKTSETIDAVIARLFPRQPFVLLFGPMLADELLENQVGAASVASANAGARDRVQTLFAKTALRIVPTTDVRGVALCGVLKNVYAIGMGIAKELKQGDNFNGWYIEQAFAEMTQILKQLGGKPSTLLEPAGIGDIIATGFSMFSKNVTYGRELVVRGEPASPSEGAVSIKPLAQRLGASRSTLPIFKKLERIVLHGANPKTIV
jgi:glycerol-3-phosphate dehydrogenase (NAD(P)+)